MIFNQRKRDKADMVHLISAMMVSNELEGRVPPGEISRISVSETGEFFTAAKTALKLIAKMHRQEPDDWDGVVWYERLNDASEGSLADRLVDMLVSEPPAKQYLLEVVIAWLKESDL